MAYETLWNSSAEKIVPLSVPRGSSEGGRLVAAKLLADSQKRPAILIKGSSVEKLIKAGQKKALEDRRPILLRLTGQGRGRPQERLVLPPKKTSAGTKQAATLSPDSKPVHQSSKTTDLIENFDLRLHKIEKSLPSFKGDETYSRLEDRVERQDEELQALRIMVEGIRRAWRKSQNLPPDHSELPTV